MVGEQGMRSSGGGAGEGEQGRNHGKESRGW